MIGISYHSGGMVDKPLAWVIEHLAHIGYDGIEIVCGPEAHIRTGDPLPPQLDQTRTLLAEHGMAVVAINPYTQPPLAQFAHQDFEGAVARWSLLIDIAVELGSRNVNFLPGWLAEGDKQAWEVLIAALKALAPYAEGKGVNLAIHNHEGQIIDSPDKCLNLIEQVGSERLKVLCDITNFWILGADVEQAVRRVGPYITHCHQKGVAGKYPFNKFLVPGEEGDELPFLPFAHALGEIGYEGYISVETFSWMRADKAQIAYDLISKGLSALGLRAAR
ncbi:MAG: sugar phosphate isomerase/epimerase [Chloroflexi bacterium]|nr:sugar phosphate isomerase/epimerase [Chloroflexota bacterium]